MQEWVAVLGQQSLARIRSAWQLYASGRVAPVALSVAAAYYAGAHVGLNRGGITTPKTRTPSCSSR